MSKLAEKIMEKVNAIREETSECPACCSIRIDWGMLQAECPPWRACKCEDCEASWCENYTWAGIDELKLKGENETS